MKPIKMGMLNRYYSLYRCPNCGAMFSSVIKVTGYDKTGNNETLYFPHTSGFFVSGNQIFPHGFAGYYSESGVCRQQCGIFL